MFTAIWCVFYWSKERILRITVIVSIAIHGIMFIPFGKVMGIGRGNTQSAYRAVNYTFVRGMSKEVVEKDTPTQEKVEEEEVIDISEKNIGNIFGDSASFPRVPTKSVNTELQGDPDHPDTSGITWFEFDKHPTGESYSKELNQLINANLEVPEEILRTGYEGKQVVFFKLSRNGELRAVFIPQNSLSSNNIVNETSIANIRRISKKFPPLPEGVKNDEVWFKVEIDYAK